MNDKDEAARPQDGAEPDATETSTDETGTAETGTDGSDAAATDADETGTAETGTAETGTEGSDAVLARLVAADPAADVEPRLGVLRAKVDAALADAPADARTGETPAAAAAGDELAARRARRRPWLAAAAVAGVVAIGGGGYAAGAAGVLAGGEGASGDVAAVSEAEAGVAEPAVPLQGGADGGADAATSGEAMSRAGVGAGAADTSYPTWFEGRAIFDGSGLSTQSGTAEAYALDARQVGTQESAQRLATALGVEGEPRWSYGAWMVGPEDGGGPTIWLSADGSAYFSYNDPRVDPWRCDVAADGTEACPTPPATQLSDEDARAALLDVMSRIGLDGAGYEVEVQPATGEDPVRWATAHQVVDGRRTGLQLSASVADQGVAWVDGALARPVSIGEYPVVSPAEAVERLGDPRFSGSSWPIAYAEEAGQPVEPVEPVEPGQDEPTPPPAPPAPGAAISWPVSEVTITEARLGLAQHHQRDGSVLVLPTYELADAQGNAWSVLAVADDAIDFDVPPSDR